MRARKAADAGATNSNTIRAKMVLFMATNIPDSCGWPPTRRFTFPFGFGKMRSNIRCCRYVHPSLDKAFKLK